MNTTHVLSHAQLRELRGELESERARLERSMARSGVAASGASSPASAVDSPEGLAADGSVGEAPLDQKATRYQAIADALRRLEDGSYGACARCQEPIPYGRLLVMPETRHCVTCGALA